MESNSLLDQKIGRKTTSEFWLGKHDSDEFLLVRVLTATLFRSNTRTSRSSSLPALVPTGARPTGAWARKWISGFNAGTDLGHMTR
jgi:hypothetical protein